MRKLPALISKPFAASQPAAAPVFTTPVAVAIDESYWRERSMALMESVTPLIEMSTVVVPPGFEMIPLAIETVTAVGAPARASVEVRARRATAVSTSSTGAFESAVLNPMFRVPPNSILPGATAQETSFSQAIL